MEYLSYLTRNEMKMIKGGSGWTRCECVDPLGHSEGNVLCSEDIESNQCCEVQYEDSKAINCEAASRPGQNQ